jgi:outer membrane lipoprotein LolB
LPSCSFGLILGLNSHEKQRILTVARIIWIFVLTLWIIGCTTIAPPTQPPAVKTPRKEREVALNRIQSWQLNGKIGVQTAQHSGSANVDWTENHGRYTVSLTGPLGAGALKLTGQPGRVTMVTADGKRFTANNPEQLLAQHWGFHLPVSNLKYWVRGLPVPGVAYSSQSDAYNRLSSLMQQGWHVQYLSYMNTRGIDLPDRISISSPSLKTKLVIHQWKIGLAE